MLHEPFTWIKRQSPFKRAIRLDFDIKVHVWKYFPRNNSFERDSYLVVKLGIVELVVGVLGQMEVGKEGNILVHLHKVSKGPKVQNIKGLDV